MTFAREYPDAPRVGVGAVILDGDRVLLVKRGQPPSQGKWSIPGGLVHLGERIEDAAAPRGAGGVRGERAAPRALRGDRPGAARAAERLGGARACTITT